MTLTETLTLDSAIASWCFAVASLVLDLALLVLLFGTATTGFCGIVGVVVGHVVARQILLLRLIGNNH